MLKINAKSASLVFAFVARLFAQQPCENLTKLALPHTTLTSAVSVAATSAIPAHCDVKATARPTSDSEINFELWLPSTGWNGKYQQVGNGGWAGSVPVASFSEPLKRGFAVAGTDDGHKGGDAAWAIGHPEKMVDFGYRAVHETAIQSHFPAGVLRQGFGSQLFCGLLRRRARSTHGSATLRRRFRRHRGGSAREHWSHLFTGFLWNERALLDDPKGTTAIAKLPTIQMAVLAQCDVLDGVKDGVIEYPRACHFNPAVLTCKSGDADECLTQPQVVALNKIYSGAKNPRTERRFFPVVARCRGRARHLVVLDYSRRQPDAAQFTFANTYFGQAVYEDPKWDFRHA